MEMNFMCGCGAQICVTLANEEEQHDQRALGFLVGEQGWVLNEPHVDDKGRASFFASCSVECHNRRFRERADDASRERHSWWTKCHKFAGEPPPCTCKEAAREDGLLMKVRVPGCPWEIWMDGWRAAHNDITRKLFERWQLVAPGTLVEHHDHYRTTGVTLRRGRVAGPAKLIEHSWGFSSAVIPVEGWRGHPRLEDLVLVVEDSAMAPTSTS